MIITEQEQKILEQVRTLSWGKVEVVIQNGKVVMVRVVKDIKLEA